MIDAENDDCVHSLSSAWLHFSAKTKVNESANSQFPFISPYEKSGSEDIEANFRTSTTISAGQQELLCRLAKKWEKTKKKRKPKSSENMKTSGHLNVTRSCNTCNQVLCSFPLETQNSDNFLKVKEQIQIHKHKFEVHSQQNSMDELVRIALTFAQLPKRRRRKKTFVLVLHWIEKGSETGQKTWKYYNQFEEMMKVKLNYSKNEYVQEKLYLLKRYEKNAVQSKNQKEEDEDSNRLLFI